MFQNYLKVTLRHLLKRKSYALINTLGLALGMAGCLLIAQYVTFEVSYDAFHEQADRIYRVSYFLFSYVTLIDLMGEERAERNLQVFHSYLYLLLDPQADPGALAARFPQFVDDHVGGEALRRLGTTLTFEIQPLQDIHFYSHRDNETDANGNPQTV